MRRLFRFLDVFGEAEWVSNWLTPLWLIGVGVLAGLVILAILAALAWSLRRVKGFERLGEVGLTLQEGPLQPIFAVAVMLALFGIVGLAVVRRPGEMIESLSRWPQLGQHTLEFEIPAPAADDSGKEVPYPVDFRRLELVEVRMTASEPLSVSTLDPESQGLPVRMPVKPGEEYVWKRGGEQKFTNPFAQDVMTSLWVRHQGTEPTTLTVTYVNKLAYPEVATSAITAAAVVLLFLFYAVLRAIAPKLSAVALSTYKSETAQPLFLILMGIGLFGVIMFEFIPYNTFGEDIKMLKMSGLTLVMLLGIIQAVWAASNSISEEVEGRTALTVLSKPIGRRDFIIGKYLGILWTVAVMFIIIGVVFMTVVAYKPIYDARETSRSDPRIDANVEYLQWWQECHGEMVSTVPGLVLAFMETSVLAAISVAISTRLPMLANFILSFAIYVLGHLTPMLVQSEANKFEIVKFFGYLISTVFPVLEYYDIQAGIAGNAPVPVIYLGSMLLYTALYSAIALLLALILFEDRDLA